jgi:hypothetical protein
MSGAHRTFYSVGYIGLIGYGVKLTVLLPLVRLRRTELYPLLSPPFIYGVQRNTFTFIFA